MTEPLASPNPFAALHGQLPTGLRRARFDHETVILRPGDTVSTLPWVERGRIRIVHHDDQGRELLLYALVPQETCVVSAVALYRNRSSQVTGIAEAGTEVLLIPAQQVRELLARDSGLKEALLLSFEARYDTLIRMVYQLAFTSVEARLSSLLEQWHREQPQADWLLATHHTLANRLGTDREVVTRALRRLVAEGRVEAQRGRLRLRPR